MSIRIFYFVCVFIFMFCIKMKGSALTNPSADFFPQAWALSAAPANHFACQSAKRNHSSFYYLAISLLFEFIVWTVR